MNKTLFQKVKEQCKDTGLSEKYLKAITEKMGGSIEDDSTDEEAISTTANLIADVAKESQGEATRWANKKNPKPNKNSKETEEEEIEENQETGDKRYSELEKRVKAAEDALKAAQTEVAKKQRNSDIQAAMKKHNIPEKFRARLANTIADDEDIEEAVAALKQDFITEGLAPKDAEGGKAATEQQVSEAADALLASIEVK